MWYPFQTFSQALQGERDVLGSRLSTKPVDKLYTHPQNVMKKLRVPWVDSHVASQSSCSFSLRESCPKDTLDKRIDMVFEASSQAIRSRTCNSWADAMAETKMKLSKKAKNTQKVVFVYSTDASAFYQVTGLPEHGPQGYLVERLGWGH